MSIVGDACVQLAASIRGTPFGSSGTAEAAHEFASNLEAPVVELADSLGAAAAMTSEARLASLADEATVLVDLIREMQNAGSSEVLDLYATLLEDLKRLGSGLADLGTEACESLGDLLQ